MKQQLQPGGLHRPGSLMTSLSSGAPRTLFRRRRQSAVAGREVSSAILTAAAGRVGGRTSCPSLRRTSRSPGSCGKSSRQSGGPAPHPAPSQPPAAPHSQGAQAGGQAARGPRCPHAQRRLPPAATGRPAARRPPRGGGRREQHQQQQHGASGAESPQPQRHRHTGTVPRRRSRALTSARRRPGVGPAAGGGAVRGGARRRDRSRRSAAPGDRAPSSRVMPTWDYLIFGCS